MNWLYLVQTISTDVVARMATAGVQALVDGAILIGPEHVAENASPNRIVFVPRASRFTPRDASMRAGTAAQEVPQGAGVLAITPMQRGTGYTAATVAIAAPDLAGGVQATATATIGDGALARVQMTALGSGYSTAPAVTISGDGTGATAIATLAPTAEQLAAMHQRPLWTESCLFDVHIWGCTYTAGVVTPNPDTDWDATATLYLILLQSLQVLAKGVHRVSALTWLSSQPDSTKLQTLGRYATLQLEIDTPVPDVLLGTPPVGTVASGTVAMELPDGTTSTPINVG